MNVLCAALQVGGLAALVVAAFMVTTALGLLAAGIVAFSIGAYVEHR